MKFFTLALFTVVLVTTSLSQNTHRLSGVIKNNDAAVVPGLSLSIEKDGVQLGGITDINGEFGLELLPGNYKITVSGIPAKNFTLFLTISANRPNPEHLDLVVPTSTLCDSAQEFPKIVKAVTPPYPPAARAVRAAGEVKVDVTVESDGSVISAKAVGGHPLLRAASVAAARQFQFEQSAAQRKLVLAFVFIDEGSEKAVKRFECPYRLVIRGKAAVIH